MLTIEIEPLDANSLDRYLVFRGVESRLQELGRNALAKLEYSMLRWEPAWVVSGSRICNLGKAYAMMRSRPLHHALFATVAICVVVAGPGASQPDEPIPIGWTRTGWFPPEQLISMDVAAVGDTLHFIGSMQNVSRDFREPQHPWYYMQSTDAGETWSEVEPLPFPGRAGQRLRLAATSDGDLGVLFQEAWNPLAQGGAEKAAGTKQRAATSRRGGQWGETKVLAGGWARRWPWTFQDDVVADSEGNFHFLWYGWAPDPNNFSYNYVGHRKLTQAGWEPVQELYKIGPLHTHITLASTPNRLHSVFLRGVGVDNHLLYTVSGDGGGIWGAPVRHPAVSGARLPGLTASGDRLFIAWDQAVDMPDGTGRERAIWLSWSEDEGDTWTPARPIGLRGHNIHSIRPIVVDDEAGLFVFFAGLGDGLGIAYVASPDDGVSWTRPRLLTMGDTVISGLDMGATAFGTSRGVHFMVQKGNPMQKFKGLWHFVWDRTTDIFEPGVPELLSATPEGDRSAKLRWRAAGDDGTLAGAAEALEIRYAYSPIQTEADWDSATAVENIPAPANAGEEQSMTVPVPSTARPIFFTMRAIDDEGQVSYFGDSIGWGGAR